MKKFTESHEWIAVEGDVGTVGITDHAQRELGEIVYVDLPTVGESLESGSEAVVLESTKAAADVYSPVSGEIVEVNDALKEAAERVNEAAESEGWLFKVRLSNPSDLEKLMEESEYRSMIGSGS